MKEELKSLFAEIVGLNNVIDDPALSDLTRMISQTTTSQSLWLSSALYHRTSFKDRQTLRSIQRSHRHPGRQYKSDRRSDNLSTGC